MASTLGKTTAVPPSSLNLFHRNPRKGDVPAIMASLRRHTQYAPITVNLGSHTGRPNEVLKGNHTTLAFRELAEVEPDDPRWRKILVFWIDVDDDLCDRIVVADNQTGQLGGFDEKELASLLSSFGADIEGLGFTEADIDDLNALLEETELPPVDSPFDKTSNDAANPGKRDDGLINAKDMTTRRDEYADAAGSRMVVLTMPIPLFVWVQGHLEKYRAEVGVETNTAAIIKLLEAWSGEVAPEMSTEEEATPNVLDGDTPADPEGFEDDDGE